MLLIGLLVVYDMLLLLLHHHLFFVISAKLKAQDLLVVDLVCRSFEEAMLHAIVAIHLIVRNGVTDCAMRLI